MLQQSLVEVICLGARKDEHLQQMDVKRLMRESSLFSNKNHCQLFDYDSCSQQTIVDFSFTNSTELWMEHTPPLQTQTHTHTHATHLITTNAQTESHIQTCTVCFYLSAALEVSNTCWEMDELEG